MELLTVKELAKLLKLHPKTVYQLVEAGELPCVRIGMRIRFTRDQVAAWVRERST